MKILDNFKKQLQKNPTRRLVFTEGEDLRILKASEKLVKEKILVPVLLGNVEKIKENAKANNIDLKGMDIIDMDEYPNTEKMVERMLEIRRRKLDADLARNLLKRSNYFGTMLVEMGEADCLLGGVTYSTSDTVRPALQLIKTKPGTALVSSMFIMVRDTKEKGEEVYAMGDCSINLYPTADELVEITRAVVENAKLFGIEPRVALLSYSTYGSAKGESVEKVREAFDKLYDLKIDALIDGEMQFDAAYDKTVGQLKAPNSKVAGNANTFIFPNIDAGNIGYKIAQRLGGFKALGPVLLGLNKPVNDLSRGANWEEVFEMALITAVQK